MNCPYCDESVHLMAKFCPKCGLPLKDDQTLMGGGRTSAADNGPNSWLIGAAAVGIVCLALAVGFFASRATAEHPAEVAKEPGTPVGSYRAPMPYTPANTPTSLGRPMMAPTSFGYQQPPQPSVVWNPQVRWATPPRPLPDAGPVYEQPDPVPPPILATGTPRDPKPPVTVAMAPNLQPEVPAFPDYLLAPVVGAGETLQNGSPVPVLENDIGRVGGGNGGGVGGNGTGGNGTGQPDPNYYVWDPVHERWAARADAPRKAGRITGGYYEDGKFYRPRQQ